MRRTANSQSRTVSATSRFLRRLYLPVTWIVLVVGVLLFLKPVLQSGKLPFGSDVLFHAQVADGIARGFSDGVLFPQWMSEATYGYGSPALMFYPPVGSYVVGLISHISGSTISFALRITVMLSALLCALSFYYAAREFANPLLSAIGAHLYVMSPYHVIDLYQRFAFAEYNAFIALPLVVKFQRRLILHPSKNAFLGFAFAASLLALTHVLITYMAVCCLLVYATMLVLYKRRSKPLINLALAGGMTVLLTAGYIIPLLVERNLINYEALTLTSYGAFERNFLYIQKVAIGYTGSKLKPILTLAFILQALLPLSAVLFVFRRRRSRIEGISLAFICFLVSMIQLRCSSWLWHYIPGIALLQFPWRFQLLQCFFGILFTIWVLSRHANFLAYCLTGTAAILLLLFSNKINPMKDMTLDQERLSRTDFETRRFVEHIPRGVPHYLQLWKKRYRLPKRRIIRSNHAHVEILEWSSHERRFQVKAKKREARIVLRTFYFPYWRADLDGKPIAVEADSKYGAIQIEVPKGVHQLHLFFQDSPLRLITRLGSLFVWLVALIYIVKVYLSRRVGPWRKDKGTTASGSLSEAEEES